MSKVAHYLQEHLVGEVMTSSDARKYFSTDAGIFQVSPALIVYPRNENDVRKTARFTWQLAERGRVIPITARGSGTDQTGGAIGSGIVLAFPAHMNKILELDMKSGTVTVEPGINYAKLQQTLHTHNRFLPPYPSSIEYSTVGGAIANNVSGEKSLRYGDTRTYVEGLRVVLANGEVIETGRLSKRELSKKLGLATFEGEIYRSLDTLLEENRELLGQFQRAVPSNNAGYDLLDIKNKDGSFDLTPLFVGSQGTLGVVTEATLSTETYSPQTTLFMATFDGLDAVQSALGELLSLSELPSVLDIVDGGALAQVQTINPNLLKDVVETPLPAAVLFVEFESSEKHLKKLVKKTAKILENCALSTQIATEPEQQIAMRKLREVTSTLVSNNEGLLRPVPIIDGAAVPIDQLTAYFEGMKKIMQSNNVKPGLWGQIGEGRFYAQPKLNLGQVGDRQKAFRMMDEYYRLIIDLGGTVSASAGDGRLRTPYLEKQYGAELYALLQKVKNIFDPYGTLNPGVKFGSSFDDLKAMVKQDYGVGNNYEHLPRT